MEAQTSKEFTEARDVALEAVKSGHINEAEVEREVNKIIGGGVEMNERIIVSFKRTES